MCVVGDIGCVEDIGCRASESLDAACSCASPCPRAFEEVAVVVVVHLLHCLGGGFKLPNLSWPGLQLLRIGACYALII